MTSKRQQGCSGQHKLGTELSGEHWKEKLSRCYELKVCIIGVSVIKPPNLYSLICATIGSAPSEWNIISCVSAVQLEHSSLTRLLGFAT